VAAFDQGGACVPAYGSPRAHYDVHEFYLSNPSTVLASICGIDSGSSDLATPVVAIYQADGGTRMQGVTPTCANAVAVAQDPGAQGSGETGRNSGSQPPLASRHGGGR